ncbi:hypothetical protein [Donghicola sp. XS_ASV15]|uniref:hypothetical protein n=1 Tax=Donghicola sp. XS_ASV15 TaxID=3241295 RepID=UPI003514CA1D
MRAGAVQALAQLVGLALAVGISVVISHRLGASPEADAFYLGRRLVTGLQEILVQVLSLVFLPMVAMQASSRGVAKLAMWVALGGIAIALVFALSAHFVVAAIAPTLTGDAAVLAERVIIVLSASLPLALLGVLAGSALNLAGWFAWPAILRLLPRVLVLTVFLLALGAQASVTWAAFAFVGGNAVALLLMVPFVRSGPVVPSARPQIGAALLLVVGAQAALWFESALAARTGVGGVALLEMAQRVGALLGNTLALAVLVPVFAKWTGSPKLRTPLNFWRTVAGGLTVLILVQGTVIYNAPKIVDHILGQGALGAAAQAELTPILIVMGFAPFATFLSRAFLIWVLTRQGKNALGIVALAVLIDLAVRAGVGVWLLPSLGVGAVALGMVLGPSAVALLLWAQNKADLRAARLSLAPLLGAGLGLLAVVGSGIVLAVVVPWLGSTQAVPTLVLIAVSGVIGMAVTVLWIWWRNALWVFKF